MLSGRWLRQGWRGQHLGDDANLSDFREPIATIRHRVTHIRTQWMACTVNNATNYRKALAIRERELGPDDEKTLLIRQCLEDLSAAGIV